MGHISSMGPPSTGRHGLRWLVLALAAHRCAPLLASRAPATKLTSRRAGIPDWDSIKPEADRKAQRMKQVREKMAELRENKQQGRDYAGNRIEGASAPPADKLAEAGFSQLMNEGEALFGGGDVEKQKRDALELRKRIAAARAYQANQTADDAAPKQTTSGIGGSWAPPEEREVHKPKVSTWGVFERPSDISKAYGGGKRIGVGAPPPVVNATKEAETKARLAKFREKNQADERVVDAHWDEIQVAVNASKRLVARGMSYEAVQKLKAVAPWCTAKTRRGADALLELALAHEAAGEGENARKVYAQLVLSPIADVKRRAKQLSFGFEAAETLGVGSYAESEGAKLARGAYDMDFSRARREEKTYARGTTIKLEKARALDSRRDVDEALRRASIGRDAFVPPAFAADALRALETFGGAPPSDAKLTERLDGDWAVVLEAPAAPGREGRYADKFRPPTLRFDDDEIVRTFPLGLLGTVTWSGAVTGAAPASLSAARVDVSPPLASGFVGGDVALDLLHLQDGVCALRDADTLLLLKLVEKRALVKRA